jgi:ankyrin repeat protein
VQLLVEKGADVELRDSFDPTVLSCAAGNKRQYIVINSNNHAIQDYQMQLMLLEQQKKKVARIPTWKSSCHAVAT